MNKIQQLHEAAKKSLSSIHPITMDDFELVKKLDAESYPDDVWIKTKKDFKKLFKKHYKTVVGFGDSYLQYDVFKTRGNYIVSLGGKHAREMMQYFLSLPSETGRYYTHVFPKNTGKTDWEGKARFLESCGFKDIGFGDNDKEETPFVYELSKMKEFEIFLK